MTQSEIDAKVMELVEAEWEKGDNCPRVDIQHGPHCNVKEGCTCRPKIQVVRL